ncbi:carbohydrate ABC transporter permease [Atribacter laminatus]|uniref:Trehalose transport system permease protein SugA n=1 Tax=Atribacter laminatus TaxID=2847778 RepID=A0A7T1F2Z8_ATRLM|nr:sugar ABC transporter permease [Atribacter laminatus]QPM67870.1 Trehalose transport system permease protein SugA [Atribacter laminatus]
MNKSERFGENMFLAPSLIIFIVLSISSLIFVLVMSFGRLNLGKFSFIFTGLSNWIDLFKDPFFRISIRNVFVIVICSVMAQYWIGLGLAHLVNRIAFGQRWIRLVILLPMMCSPVVVGFMWKMLFLEAYGPLNYFLNAIGLPSVSWLSNPKLAMMSVIIAEVWEWTPFVFIFMLAALKSLSPEPFEAAHIDGATKWEIFRHITLPLLAPISSAIILFRCIETFKSFDIVFILTAGGPGTATLVPTLYAYSRGLRGFDLGFASANSITLFIIITIFAIIFLGAGKKVSPDLSGN